MKILFGTSAIVASLTMGGIAASVDVAEARGGLSRGSISSGQIKTGPRVVQMPKIKAMELPSSKSHPRVITGPRESGRGVNCRFYPTGSKQITHINPRTGASETTTIQTGNERCPLRI
jgi:hypothetical protein